ncbi:MAG: flagellar M-ring protein FliF [Phenylobacterium sp.]|jgi:flagellar M-ring protein FliF
MFNFQSLSRGQKAVLLTLSTLVLLVAGYVVLVLLNPQYVVIYQHQKLAQVAKVTRQLVLEDIDYRLGDNGTVVSVPLAYADKIKVKLAEVSATEHPSSGFELFDSVDYSMTEQAQKVTYQRALQGELERTLSAYHEVAQARVLIMLPEAKLFSLDKAMARASVALIFEPGGTMSEGQISGVQALAAAAVEGLSEDNVVVLNGDGLKISSHEDKSAIPGKPEHQGQRLLEQQLGDKALHLLSLYFKPSQLAVSVTVILSQTQIKQVEQSLLADEGTLGFVSRKKETVHYNQPGEKDAAGDQDKQSEIEYVLGNQTRETTVFAGGIKRLNVAIAIVGEIEVEQLEKIRQLISAGLGIEEDRGDRLSVEGLMFIKPMEPEVEVPEVVEKPIAVIAPPVATEPELIIVDDITPPDNRVLMIVIVSVMFILLFLLLLYWRQSSKTKPTLAQPARATGHQQPTQLIQAVEQYLADHPRETAR